jgi:hypothetical protein
MANIGYCGDDCDLCPRYIATKSGDRGKLMEAAVLWKKVGLKDKIVPPEGMICHGCSTLEMCHYNEIRECAKRKDINNCGKCGEYPCDKIKAVFDKTSAYAQRCKDACEAGDYERLNEAFFLKKKRLDAIHSKNDPVDKQ